MNNQKINNLLKDPRTNWKFIWIVVILGFLVGGGILGYWLVVQQEVKPPEEVPTEVPEVEEEAKQEQIIPRLSKKPLEEPNYLAYLKREVLERNERGETREKYTLIVVKEGETEKKALFSYVRDGINLNQGALSLGYVYGKDNIFLQRIKGDIDIKIFNKNGEDPLALSFYKKHKDKGGVGFEDDGPAIRDIPAVSRDNKLIAYIKLPVTEQQKSIAVFNLETNNEKIYKIDGDYREIGFILHLSPDNKKLYVCICVEGEYFAGPSPEMWEIDLESGQVASLDYINELGIRNGIFRYDPNSMYGAKYETFEREQVGTPRRSKTLYKVNLDTREIKKINFSNYFEGITISKTGNFADTIYYGDFTDEQRGRFVKNLRTGEEFKLEVSKIGLWSDNDKLTFTIYNANTDKLDLYIYNPVDETKILVDTIVNGSLKVIGWIH